MLKYMWWTSALAPVWSAYLQNKSLQMKGLESWLTHSNKTFDARWNILYSYQLHGTREKQVAL